MMTPPCTPMYLTAGYLTASDGLPSRLHASSLPQPSFNGAAKIATTPAPQPYTQMGRWLVFWFVFTLPLALIGTFGSLGASGSGDVSIAFVPAGMLLAFGYYGLDYTANQLQNPFIAEFGDVALDGRFTAAVCADVDLLLRVDADEPSTATSGDTASAQHEGTEAQRT